jgi:predicted nucleic acid-binding protein
LIILDASVIVESLLGLDRRATAIADEMRRARFLHTLDLAYVEVVSTLRRRAASRELTSERLLQALSDLATAPFMRHPAAPYVDRIWELRHGHTAYDAAYLALAEALAMPLLTTDRRLARSTGHRAEIIEAGA